MRWMKWISLLAAITVIISCYYPWLTVPAKGIVISGVSAEGTTYGKPGYFNFLLTGLYLVLTMVPQLWAKRMNIFVAALNFAWSIRNFILLSRCEAGDCPEHQTFFYVYFIASIVMMVGALFTSTGKPLKD